MFHPIETTEVRCLMNEEVLVACKNGETVAYHEHM